MYFFIIFLIVVMLALGALLSAAETAITASSPGKINKKKIKSQKRQQIVFEILKSKDKVISTLLIGNSLINTICTTMAAGVFIDLFDESYGTVISSIVMSVLVIVVCEVAPKTIAIAKSEAIVVKFAPAISIALWLLTPVNTLLDYAIRAFCRLVRIDLNPQISAPEEVRGIIEHHHHEGHVYKRDRDMLGGVLDIIEMNISEIMIHRSNIVSMNIDQDVEVIIKEALAAPYTRIPLWKNTKENIVGVLHIRDLLRALFLSQNDPKVINLQNVIKEPWFISENALVSHQLSAFIERKSHFACVVDEYGDLQGVITLEDILEEIVGQIYDEHDNLKDMITKKSANTLIIQGTATIRDINRELSWSLPDENANTIAGLIIHEAKRIPAQGEVLNMFDLKITIHKRTGNKIDTLKITTR